jgi:hypothetical protein
MGINSSHVFPLLSSSDEPITSSFNASIFTNANKTSHSANSSHLINWETNYEASESSMSLYFACFLLSRLLNVISQIVYAIHFPKIRSGRMIKALEIILSSIPFVILTFLNNQEYQIIFFWLGFILDTLGQIVPRLFTGNVDFFGNIII